MPGEQVEAVGLIEPRQVMRVKEGATDVVVLIPLLGVTAYSWVPDHPADVELIGKRTRQQLPGAVGAGPVMEFTFSLPPGITDAEIGFKLSPPWDEPPADSRTVVITRK